MRPNFTLPELQTRLGRLDQGAMLGISDPDFEWLFAKKNDVAAARLFHFAHFPLCQGTWLHHQPRRGRDLF
jgi:hypothetical protein